MDRWRDGRGCTEELQLERPVGGVCPVRPAFDHRVLDLACKHHDHVDVLFPDKATYFISIGKNKEKWEEYSRPEVDKSRR